VLDLNSLKFEMSAAKGVYSELRYQENTDLRLSLLNGQLVTNLQESSRGVSARAFSGGYWGFSSHVSPTRESAARALQEAIRNATFLSGRKKKSASLAEVAAMQFERSYASQRAPIETAAWIDFMKAIDAIITAKYKDLKARSVALMSLDMEKHFLTSDGSLAHTMVPRAHISISMTKDSAHGPVQARDVRGGLGQMQDQLTPDPKQFEEWIESVYQMVSKKSNGILPTSGEHDVILAADLAGILAHEAVGHTAEADLVLGGSVAGDCLNKTVASPLVTLVDFAHTYEGAPAPQPVHVDDEGVAATDTVIIEKGILKTFMNNRETAAHFSQAATGHARAFTFADEPLIRMRNTAILPGRSKVEEMIASIENGYYLMKAGNGQADTTGEFMFATGFGYEIKNGKLARPLRDATISGVAFDMLKSVTMVSDDFEWESSGYCGKKQPMPVGMGGPAIKCRLQVGGE
jgi:TldD protein